MTKTVEIIIQADGEVVINALGFQGIGCAKATADLQKVLAGGGDVETTKKPEFWQSTTGKTTN